LSGALQESRRQQAHRDAARHKQRRLTPREAARVIQQFVDILPAYVVGKPLELISDCLDILCEYVVLLTAKLRRRTSYGVGDTADAVGGATFLGIQLCGCALLDVIDKVHDASLVGINPRLENDVPSAEL